MIFFFLEFGVAKAIAKSGEIWTKSRFRSRFTNSVFIRTATFFASSRTTTAAGRKTPKKSRPKSRLLRSSRHVAENADSSIWEILVSWILEYSVSLQLSRSRTTFSVKNGKTKLIQWIRSARTENCRPRLRDWSKICGAERNPASPRAKWSENVDRSDLLQ